MHARRGSPTAPSTPLQTHTWCKPYPNATTRPGGWPVPASNVHPTNPWVCEMDARGTGPRPGHRTSIRPTPGYVKWTLAAPAARPGRRTSAGSARAPSLQGFAGIVHPPARSGAVPKPIVVGFDPKTTDRAPVEFGVAAARFTGAPLIVA